MSKASLRTKKNAPRKTKDVVYEVDELEDIVVPEVPQAEDKPKKGFRFQACKGLLTYKTHLNKEDYIKWFAIKTKQTPSFIRVAHETGEDETYNHSHVVFQTPKNIDTVSERFFDYEGIHPHIKKLASKKALKDAKGYIAKEDPENADLLEEESVVEAIWKQNSLQDALKMYCKKPADANGIIALYNMRADNIEVNDEDIPSEPWHKEFIESTKDRPNKKQRRQVTWYYDKKGGAGKTMLARYLKITEPNKWFVAKDMGTSKDAATVISNALASGWTSHGMIIDFPRSAENHKRIYSYIEEIKDGFVTTQKYQGTTCVFNVPHLIIFANWLPKFYMLSRDRWNVLTLKRVGDEVYATPYVPSKKELENPRNEDSDEADSDDD